MFGKILVVLHLGLSIVFATWAMSLYLGTRESFRVVDKDAIDGVKQEDLRRLAGRTDENTMGTLQAFGLPRRMQEHSVVLNFGVRGNEPRRRGNLTTLEKEEEARPLDRAWYKQQIDFLLEKAAKDNWAKKLERDANGLPTVVVDPKPGADRLKMTDIVDANGGVLNLVAMSTYNKDYKDSLDDEKTQLDNRNVQAARDAGFTKLLTGANEEEIKDILDLIKKRKEDAKWEADLRSQLTGDKKHKFKGMLERISMEVRKIDEARDEYVEVAPRRLNTAAELKNLDDLRKRLKERLEELQTLKSKGNKEGK